MEELWKDIEGYEGLYQVSSMGRVKSLNYNGTGKERIMKPYITRKGYLQFALCKDGKVKRYYVHRLVAEAFIDNTDNLPIINHRDQNPSNNCVDNLEWCDHKYNLNYGDCQKRRVKKRMRNGNYAKIIYQYTIDGELIKEYQSAYEVQRELGYYHTNINACCLGKQKTSYGYIWKYGIQSDKQYNG